MPQAAAKEPVLNQPYQHQHPLPPEGASAVEPDETAVPDETPKTEEELLDQSLVETFPASDPISPGAGIGGPARPRSGSPGRRPKKA